MFGQARDFQHSSALAQDQFQHPQEFRTLAEMEQFLDIAGIVGIQPFGIKFRVRRRRQQGLGQSPRSNRAWISATPKAADSSANTGVSSTTRLRPARLSLNFVVAARVEEPVARTFRPGKASAAILSTRLRIRKLVHLVQDQQRFPQRPEEAFRIREPGDAAGKITIDELRFGQRSGKHGLAGPPNAGQPQDRRLLPGALQTLDPEGTFDHESKLIK